jgi:hypothetical protein
VAHPHTAKIPKHSAAAMLGIKAIIDMIADIRSRGVVMEGIPKAFQCLYTHQFKTTYV